MSRKRVIIGQAEFGIPENQVREVAAQVKSAMENGETATLQLLDGAGREVTVYLNGKAAALVVVDLDPGPRPSEISG
ncbi:hypothetical protein ACFQY4_44260 [Catellatospora bangladeshensis]|uniref:Uncharacterized protein n=1 Tax=Catellatospora bangladeshensis TaxID=310355 RepID=A0A8J3NJQ8_9ACTN|nr:hypothetical protein [Catellatospora bangladeshensis]GIF83710.1 hypothetical protein Cba03nite_50590 [Catellatospora bangladeshensis]